LPSHAFIGPDVAWNTMFIGIGIKLSAHDRVEIRADLDILPVPEPATWALWLAGGLALLAWRRRAARA
jgi:PEP-CTERM motif